MRTSESRTATTNLPVESSTNVWGLPAPAKLAAAWTSVMFLYLYVDYLALYKPGFLDEIRSGHVHEFTTGPTFVSLALTLMAVPILMIVLSATLPARLNRPLNLAVAALYILSRTNNQVTARLSDKRCNWLDTPTRLARKVSDDRDTAERELDAEGSEEDQEGLPFGDRTGCGAGAGQGRPRPW